MTTYRVDLAYDGAGFHGYARQQSVRTVQGELETALEPFTGPVETFVAGRTDRGVHAAAQVVSFTVADPIDTAAVTRSLNRRLGPEIAVKRLAEAPDGFHARFSAVGRVYEYLVLDAGHRTRSWPGSRGMSPNRSTWRPWTPPLPICSASTTSPPSAAGRATARW